MVAAEALTAGFEILSTALCRELGREAARPAPLRDRSGSSASAGGHHIASIPPLFEIDRRRHRSLDRLPLVMSTSAAGTSDPEQWLHQCFPKPSRPVSGAVFASGSPPRVQLVPIRPFLVSPASLSVLRSASVPPTMTRQPSASTCGVTLLVTALIVVSDRARFATMR